MTTSDAALLCKLTVVAQRKELAILPLGLLIHTYNHKAVGNWSSCKFGHQAPTCSSPETGEQIKN